MAEENKVTYTVTVPRSKTKISAIAVIADRTAYDVRYAGFGYKYTNVWYGGGEFMNAPKLNPLKHD